MKKMVCKIVGLALLLALPYTFAHSGHDHSHWSSGIIHVLWIGALFTIVALAVVILKKRIVLKYENNQSEEG